METWRRNLYIMLASVFVAQASFTLVTPFLPYFLKSLSAERNLATWSGLAYSASFLTSGIMSPVWGSVADRYGKRMQILRSGLGIAVMYALYPLARTPLQFVLMRGLTGVLSGFLPAATSLVATNTPEDRMGYALGLFQAVSAAGTISGPLLGGIMTSVVGIPATFRLSAVILALFTVATFVMLKESASEPSGALNVIADVKQAFRHKQLRMVFACMFLVQAGMQVTGPTLTLYIDQMAGGRNSTLTSGIIYSIAGLGTVLGATYTAKRTDESRVSTKTLAGNSRLGYDAVTSTFLLGLLGSAMFSALQGVWVHVTPLAVFRLFFGAFNGLLVVSGNILAAKSVDREFRGRAFGVMNGVLPLGSVTGPLVGGAVGDKLGLGSAFYASSLVFILSALVLLAFKKPSSATRPSDRPQQSSPP